MITCMKMISFILKYTSKIMFYDVNIACYHRHIMNLIDLTHLTQLVHVSIGILQRFTMEDRSHTHHMRIYPKIYISTKWCMNTSNESLEDRPSIITKASPNISLIVLSHI